MAARVSTRCVVCGTPRADHGNVTNSVADHEGNLGPRHMYQALGDPAPCWWGGCGRPSVGSESGMAMCRLHLDRVGMDPEDWDEDQSPTPRKDQQ